MINSIHSSLSARVRLGSRPITWLVLACSILTFTSLTRAGQIPPPPLRPSDNFNIAIPRAGLGSEYLMSMSVIPQFAAPTSHGLAGRIVQFELFHDGVDLYEATKGLVVTDELPARRLLTTFEIVRQDAGQVVINFNKGMRRVFSEGWYDTSPGFDATGRDVVAEVPQSRVFEVSQGGDQLVIRQTLQTRDREFNSNLEGRYEVRYFFNPYATNSFAPKEMTPFETRYARFWETQGQLEPNSGRVTVKMGRFDIQEPVTFYYSANTPADYVQAVSDGILYWNRAFGRNLVRAEKAPDGVTAPDARYNIIQWVPFDNAGSAYADVLLDPRSGQARHGQAYMTSVFAISGKSRARALLRSMREIAQQKESNPQKLGAPGLSGFVPQTACQMDTLEFAQQLAQGLQDLLANDNLTDEVAMRASQDYVRQVTAHEVGHVLGLRHNFAGSLAATLSPKELDNFIEAYITGKDLDSFKDKNVSNSTMEYTAFKGGIFIGWKIRNTEEPLPHDKAAIQWGYFDSKEVVTNRMLFATDPDAGAFGDVIRFDYGSDPLLAAYQDLSDNVNHLPNAIIETFISARAPRDPRDRVPLEKVALFAGNYARQIRSYNARLLMWFASTTRSRKVENAFEFISDLNEIERHQAHWKALTNQLENLGGVDQALFAWLPVNLKLDTKKTPSGVDPATKLSATNLVSRLEKLLEAPAYTNFVGLDDQRYSFTSDEKKLILERGKKLFEELEETVLAQICMGYENATRDLALAAFSTIDEDDAVSQLEKRVIELATEIITAKHESTRLKGKVDKAFVEVVEFKYDYETRLAAAKALNDKTGSFTAWAKEAKGALNKKLKDDVDAALNITNFKTFQDSMLSRPLRDWYLKQQEILKLLPATRPATPERKEDEAPKTEA